MRGANDRPGDRGAAGVLLLPVPLLSQVYEYDRSAPMLGLCKVNVMEQEEEVRKLSAEIDARSCRLPHRPGPG